MIEQQPTRDPLEDVPLAAALVGVRFEYVFATARIEPKPLNFPGFFVYDLPNSGGGFRRYTKGAPRRLCRYAGG